MSEVRRNGTAVYEFVDFDGRTGRILGRIPIPGDADFIDGPVTDGIIAIHGYDTDLHAERPDIRGTHRLPS